MNADSIVKRHCMLFQALEIQFIKKRYPQVCYRRYLDSAYIINRFVFINRQRTIHLSHKKIKIAGNIILEYSLGLVH